MVRQVPLRIALRALAFRPFIRPCTRGRCGRTCDIIYGAFDSDSLDHAIRNDHAEALQTGTDEQFLDDCGKATHAVEFKITVR